jgi:hypothetical protein
MFRSTAARLTKTTKRTTCVSEHSQVVSSPHHSLKPAPPVNEMYYTSFVGVMETPSTSRRQSTTTPQPDVDATDNTQKTASILMKPSFQLPPSNGRTACGATSPRISFFEREESMPVHNKNEKSVGFCPSEYNNILYIDGGAASPLVNDRSLQYLRTPSGTILDASEDEGWEDVSGMANEDIPDMVMEDRPDLIQEERFAANNILLEAIEEEECSMTKHLFDDAIDVVPVVESMFANLFNEFRGKCFYPIFRGFLVWTGAQTTKQQNPRWVQESALVPNHVILFGRWRTIFVVKCHCEIQMKIQ